MEPDLTEAQIEELSPKVVDGKIVYSSRNMILADAKLRWPDHVEVKEGDKFLVGETFVHGAWHPLKTSPVVSIDRENNLVMTRNSYYKLIDDSLAG